MIVFTNTTPIIALSSIQRLDLLPALFGQIHIVNEVLEECEAGGNIRLPELRNFDWLTIVTSTAINSTSLLLALDKGEKHTLDMAQKYHADWVLIDEKFGRNMAEYLGLRVTGTLGILLKAKQQGMITSFKESITSMQNQGIYYHPNLIKKLLTQIGES
jgi:predicted nucleic acid-binding protein